MTNELKDIVTLKIARYIKRRAEGNSFMTDEGCLVAAKFIVNRVPKFDPDFKKAMRRSADESSRIEEKVVYNRCKTLVKEIWNIFIDPLSGRVL